MIDIIDKLEYFVSGNFHSQLEILHKNLTTYYLFVNKYYANFVSDKDEKIEEIVERPGSMPYLVMKSHSLSYTQFWPKVEEGLRGAFSSGKNPGYKKK